MIVRLRLALDAARRLTELRLDDLRALWWVYRVFPAVRRDLAASGTSAKVPPAPMGLSLWAGRTVLNFLQLRKATCLEKAIIMQRWLSGHGKAVPVIIGIRNDADGFAAHAWLPGYDRDEELTTFTEISRIEPGFA